MIETARFYYHFSYSPESSTFLATMLGRGLEFQNAYDLLRVDRTKLPKPEEMVTVLLGGKSLEVLGNTSHSTSHSWIKLGKTKEHPR
jgi:hypothetical protein